jgi:hypothetical protein
MDPGGCGATNLRVLRFGCPRRSRPLRAFSGSSTRRVRRREFELGLLPKIGWLATQPVRFCRCIARRIQIRAIFLALSLFLSGLRLTPAIALPAGTPFAPSSSNETQEVQDWLPGMARTQPRLGSGFGGSVIGKRGLAPAPFPFSSVLLFLPVGASLRLEPAGVSSPRNHERCPRHVFRSAYLGGLPRRSLPALFWTIRLTLCGRFPWFDWVGTAAQRSHHFPNSAWVIYCDFADGWVNRQRRSLAPRYAGNPRSRRVAARKLIRCESQRQVGVFNSRTLVAT